MTQKSKDAKLQLGEPWAGMLAAICEAHHNAPQKDIIKAAIELFVADDIGKNDGIRQKYEEIRRRQRGEDDKVRLIHPSPEEKGA